MAAGAACKEVTGRQRGARRRQQAQIASRHKGTAAQNLQVMTDRCELFTDAAQSLQPPRSGELRTQK